MNRELTDFEKNTKMLAEQENPYDSACPNRHLYNEGFENGFTTATKIKSTLSALLPENKEVKKAEEILDEEISDNLKNILEQSDTPEELKSFKRYILDAMERYKSQTALPTKEKEDNKICLRVESKLVEIMQEMAEMDELRDDYKDQSEWHRFMNKLRIKQYLLEEILGIE